MPFSIHSALALLSAALFTGCGAPAGDIHALFVSESKYQALTCEQIGIEAERVARRVAEIAGTEYVQQGGGTPLIGRPIVVSWPGPWSAIVEPESLEFLKGSFEALGRASAQKRCSYQFQQRQS